MAAALRTVRAITTIAFLLLLATIFATAYAAAQNGQNSGIEKQLNILQKLQDYNVATAESTLRNVSFLIAFLGGILSFLAPCTVALFPAFLAFTTKSGRNITLATTTFFAGFSLTFIILGIALTALGRVSFVTFQQDIAVLVQAAGVVLIFLGIMMFFGKGFSFIQIRGRLPKDAFGTFIFGALFAIGWSACIGPVIAGIFTMAAVFNNYAYTALLLFFYALGLAIPLFVVSFAYDRFNLAESRLIKGFTITLNIGKKELLLASTNIISGLLLIFLGALFIISRGTTLITAADLLGTIFLLAALAAAAVLVHKFIIARLISDTNARKLAAVAEIVAAIAAFAFITNRYSVHTVGLTERLSDAVLENTARFNFVAAAVLIAFIALLFYFVKRQLKAKGKNMKKVKGGNMKNKKWCAFILVQVVVLLLMSTAAVAHADDELAVGKGLVEKSVSCDKLSDEQLETIGEYLMEQMHPGEAHELMHKMMGIEEGTPYHDQFHVNLAQAMYCDTIAGGTSAATGGSGMMGSGRMMPMMHMMPMMSAMAGQGAQGMMGRFGYGSYGYGSGYSNLINVLFIVLLLGLIGLVYFWLLKMWKDSKSKSR